jgi:PPP family 3-phenylpropionic acid transporter
LAFYTLHSLAFSPSIALQDGYFFSLAKRSDAVSASGYHKVRVWGTIGFIVPSLALYFLLEWQSNLTVVLWAAMTCGFLSACHAQRLPAIPASESDGKLLEIKNKLPSLEAFAALIGPKGRWFVLSLFLAFGASTAYHAFFPLYLRSSLGMKISSIGLIINIGVFLEVFFILGLGRMRKRFGMRALMIAGLCAMTMRLFLLAAFPSTFTAIMTQLLHGLEICAIYVLPVMYLNQLASDRFRNSIQGVYTMLVIGGSRIAGGLLAGHLAQIDLKLLFYYAASLAFTSVIILFIFFHPDDDRGEDQAERTA